MSYLVKRRGEEEKEEDFVSCNNNNNTKWANENKVNPCNTSLHM